MKVTAQLCALTLPIVLGSCRPNQIEIGLDFGRDLTPVVNTDNGRLFVLPETMARCADLDGDSVEDIASRSVIDRRGHMCEFVDGFDVDDWPAGPMTVAFVGYDDAEPGKALLFGCADDIEHGVDHRVSLDVRPTDAYTPSVSACPATGIDGRCYGTCD